jgi:hypothetical protein
MLISEQSARQKGGGAARKGYGVRGGVRLVSTRSAGTRAASPYPGAAAQGIPLTAGGLSWRGCRNPAATALLAIFAPGGVQA